MSEYRHPLFTVIEAVKHHDAMKVLWAQLNDTGKYNLKYILGYYDSEVRQKWLDALDDHEKEDPNHDTR